MAVPQNLKIELMYNPAIPLQGIYPKVLKLGTQTDYVYTHIHSGFTLAERWKPPKCLQMNGWTKCAISRGLVFSLNI